MSASSVNPGTVPTAGTNKISAPASISSFAISRFITGSFEPAPCIFPAIMTPVKYFFAF